MDRIVDLAALVRRGERSAVETVATALDAAEASQAELNAFITIDRDGALARAADLDERIAAGQDPGPLTGVSVGLKDLIDQAGFATTNGAAFPASPARKSATVVRRLEDAGAVIIGRTGLHEFAFGFTSENQHFGPVRNPWDPGLSAGGSSGGSASAVAAGVVSAGIGTDTGGSVRVPAALCGVVGLKVTHGRVPLTGVTPLASSLDTVGPITRSVADAATLYAVIAGDDRTDPWSAPADVELPREPRDPSTLSIGVPVQWMGNPIDQVTGTAFRGTLALLDSLGAVVEEIDEPALEITDAAANAAALEVFHAHRERWEHSPELYGTDVAARLRKASIVDPGLLVDALEWDAAVRHAFERIFTRFDALAMPTVGGTRKVIGEDDMDIDGERFFHRQVIAQFTWPVNRTGNPALALPIPGDGTPPASLQVVGPRWGEGQLLEIGLGLEAAGISAVRRPPHFYG